MTSICLKGFPNVGNTCYMDVILFCLFATPNDFLERNFLKSRKTYVECTGDNILKDFKKIFIDISNAFHNEDSKMSSCKDLKKLIRKYRRLCPMLSQYPDFSNNEQHEALEFLQFILTLFGMNGLKDVGNHLKIMKRYGVSNNSKKTRWLEWFERIDKKSSIIYYVNHDNYKQPKKSIERFLNNHEIVHDLIDTRYKKCIVNSYEETQTFVSYSDVFIVAVDRINPFTGIVSHSKISIDKIIPSSDLKIDAVVVHIGESKSAGHYVCFKKCLDKWVLYDDLTGQLQTFDSWNKALNYKNNLIQKNGVLFFYSKVQV